MLVIATTVLLVGGLVGAAGAAAEKIDLCHLPGTPDETTLNVSQNAVGAHIAHGDTLGSCDDLPEPPPPPILTEVLARGDVQCGVSGNIPGFSLHDVGPDTWEGLDVDLCRAVAAAVFGDEEAVEFVAVSSAERFSAVRDGVVDVLFRTTTDTLRRDATEGNGGEGVNFGPTYFYDGDSFLSHDPIQDFLGLEGLTICVMATTSTASNLDDLLSQEGIEAFLSQYDTFSEAVVAFAATECDALAGNQSGLVATKASSQPNDWEIFDGTFSKGPLAPVVREGDDEWMAVVRWVVFATIEAEERGVSQSNVGASSFGTDTAPLGALLGLGEDWAFDIVDRVGNYADVFDRNLAPLGLPRGDNATHLDGGLLIASLLG